MAVNSKYAALAMTVLVAGAIGYWAWTGVMQPPLAEPMQIVTTPSGWAQLDAGTFTLYAPGGSQIRVGADGWGDLLGPDIYIRFHLGPYSGNQDALINNPGYSESPVTINGHKGFLRQTTIDTAQQQALFGGYGRQEFVGLYVPDIGTVGGKPAVLEMYGTTPSPEERDAIELVYKSVRFKRGP